LKSTELENLKGIVLVTGATGMLGSRLVFDLVQAGYKVRAIYREKNRIDQFKKNIECYDADQNLLDNNIEWVEADLLNFFQLTKALAGIDMVYHCAAMVSFHPSEGSEMFNNNINGTANLVNACLEEKIKRICYVSSIAALGKSDNGELINEETAWIPDKKHSRYGISKFHSEMEIWRGVNEGLDAIIVNPSVIIGPGDWFSGSPAFFRQIDKGLKFYTQGINGFVDVRDVSKAMLLLTNESNIEKAKNNRFLLNSANMSYESFFKLIAASIRAVPPKYQAAKWMMIIAGELAKWFGVLSGTKTVLTRETIRNATSVSTYDGSKIVAQFGFQYRDIESSIAEIGTMYQKYKRKNGMKDS
jgi:dihydroflavonol-4-reductase